MIPTDEVRVGTVAIDASAGVDEALKNRPEVRSAIYSAANARINYEFARNQLLPQLDLNAQYGYAGLGGPNHILDANGDPTGVVLPGNWSDAFSQVRHGDFHNWTVGVTLSRC